MEEPNNAILYVYRSPFGTMSIRPDLDRSDSWLFIFEEHSLASNGDPLVHVMTTARRWKSAEAAAEAVLAQTTGWDFWDALPGVVFPASLDDWLPVQGSGTTTAP